MTIEPSVDLLSSGDVAKLLGVTPSAVHRWDRLGLLPALRTASGVRLFTRTAVLTFAETRQPRLSRVASSPTSDVPRR